MVWVQVKFLPGCQSLRRQRKNPYHLGLLLLWLYHYLYRDPAPATINRFYGTLAMGHLLGCLSLLSFYYLPEYFEFAQPWSEGED